jgi:hypothetical protein
MSFFPVFTTKAATTVEARLERRLLTVFDSFKYRKEVRCDAVFTVRVKIGRSR